MRAFFLSAGAVLLLAACAPEPLPVVGPLTSRHSPANPDAPAPRAAYAPVTSGYRHYAPVEAGDWRELNRRVAPQQSQQGGAGHAH